MRDLGSRISVSGGACIWACVLLLMLPLRWVVAAILAAAVHELSHLLALYLLGIRVFGIAVGGRGAVLETDSLTDGQELLCALAGPVGSFVLLIFAQWIPRVALCGLCQGLYNLIPLGNLDGGRVLRSLVNLVHRKKPCKQGKERVQ